MTPDESKQLNAISASLARLEGAVTEHARSVDRQFTDLHGRIGGVKADADTRMNRIETAAHERMSRIDGEVASVRHEVNRPAAVAGGTAGSVFGFLAAAVWSFLGGK